MFLIFFISKKILNKRLFVYKKIVQSSLLRKYYYHMKPYSYTWLYAPYFSPNNIKWMHIKRIFLYNLIYFLSLNYRCGLIFVLQLQSRNILSCKFKKHQIFCLPLGFYPSPTTIWAAYSVPNQITHKGSNVSIQGSARFHYKFSLR